MTPPSPSRGGFFTILGTLALLIGGALAQLAATAPLAWGMVLGSGVDVAGAAWLMNVTEAMVVVGAMVGGWLLDAGRRLVLWCAPVALAAGTALAWALPSQGGAVLVGLAALASWGAGVMLAAGLVVVVGASGRGRGLWAAVALAGGLALTESIWGSASMLALSRGAQWVFGRTGMVATGAALASVGLLLLALRWGWWGQGTEPLLRWRWEAPPEAEGRRAADGATFWLLAAVAFLGAFAGLVAQRAGAVLSLLGLPEGSFASGILVGYTFALCRLGGVLLGGLLFELTGPRTAYGVTTSLLAITSALVAVHAGYDAPWRALIGAVGVACGLATIVVPVAAAHLLGRRNFGFHFGYLYLAATVGSVMVLPLAPLVASFPAACLGGIVVAALSLAIGVGRLVTGPRAAG